MPLKRDKATGLLVTVGRARPAPIAPPFGYSSWLEYAAKTMDTRTLLNEHQLGGQSQWKKGITSALMRKAVAQELRQFQNLQHQIARCLFGATDETAEIASNPKAMRAIRRHKAGLTTFGKLDDI